MTELSHPFPYEYLRDKYPELSPADWAGRFVTEIATEELDTPDGLIVVPSKDFLHYLFQETIDLILDMDLSDNPDDLEETVENLVERDRVEAMDEVDFFDASDEESSEIIRGITLSSFEKLGALSDYLIENRYIQGVPLALLTGNAEGIFTYDFARIYEVTPLPRAVKTRFHKIHTGDDERGKVIRKAQKLHENGGRIIFPLSTPDGFLQALVVPRSNRFAHLGFGPISQRVATKLIITANQTDEMQILPMLIPNEIAIPDEE